MIRARNRLHRRTFRAIAAAAAVVACAATAGAAADAPAERAAAPTTDAPSRTVTLVTGDRVVVTPRGGRTPLVDVEPAPGRDDVGFSVHVTKHEITVTPMDAAPLLADGRLDRRLFEVHRLLASGYGDARRDDLPLITSRPIGALRAQRTISTGGLTAVQADKAKLTRTWREFVADPSARLWLDGKVRASTDGSVPRIGAPAAWEKGLTGEGVTVAVLDTGVDAGHPDLEVAESANFAPASSADDTNGHGTHVASVIAGSGAASDGKYRGVAPDARLVSGKVLDDNGHGQESWLIAGMTWAVKEAGADVVNISATCWCDSAAIDPMERAVNELSAETGALFVAPAGAPPLFPFPGVITLPAAAESALGVASVDPRDRPSSNVAGPRRGDYLVKPELLAPGEGIVAARAAGTSAGAPVDDHYTSLSGTSVAAPHVAGAAAVLAQQHPEWDGRRLKSTLMASAKRLPVHIGLQGAGRVDVGAAVEQPISASPPSLNPDVRWPDSGPSKVDQKVTYKNSSADPVDLRLALDVTGPGGFRLPAGAATFDRDRVTVPPNGEATVTLTLRGVDGVWPGLYHGALIATGADGPVVATPVAAYVEPPTSIVTIDAIDLDGSPTGVNASLTNLETGIRYDARNNGDGVFVARVPVGTYDVSGQFETAGWRHGFRKIYELEAGATTVPMDARTNVPVEFTNDRPGAELTYARATLELTTDEFWSATLLAGSAQQRISVQPGSDERHSFAVEATWQKAGVDPSPYVMHDFGSVDPGIPADPALHTRRAEMARIRTSIRALGSATSGWLRSSVSGADGDRIALMRVERPVPGSLTLYLRAGEQLSWRQELRLFDESGRSLARMYRDPQVFRARPYMDVWNAAVLGPVPADSGNERDGNVLSVVPSHSATGALADRSRDYTRTGTFTLSRGGTVLAATGIDGDVEVTVPAEAATYTVRESVTWPDRPAGAVPTGLDVVWTFRSAGTDGPERLPLQVVRFLPAGLDERNRAPAHRPTLVPYWVERAQGAPAAPVTSIEIEASFDDGATWQRLRTAGGPALGLVLIDPPDGAEFVSLRATAEDADGNSVVQTVVRAYGLSATNRR